MKRPRVFEKVKGSGEWWIDYAAPGHKRTRRKIGAKASAEKIASKIHAEVAEGRYLDRKVIPRKSFTDMADAYLEWSKLHKRSWNRDETSLVALRDSFDGMLGSEITAADVEQHKARRIGAGLSPQTVVHELQCGSHLFKLAMAWGDALENPFAPVKRPRVRSARLRYLSHDEEDALLAACSTLTRHAVIIGIYTGLRMSEILSLRWQDVDFDNDLIHVEHTKNDRRRDVPMLPIVRQQLRGIPQHIKSPYVLTKITGQPYKRVSRGFRAACRRAKLQGVVFHTLRHTFASRLVMGGADLLTVKELLGHADLTMVMRYAHLSPEHRRKAVMALARPRDAKAKERA